LKTPLSAKAREGMMVQVDPSNYRNFTSCNYGNSLNVKLALPIFLPLCICIPDYSLLRTFQFLCVSFLSVTVVSSFYLFFISFISLLPFVHFLFLFSLSFSVSLFDPLTIASPLVSISVAHLDPGSGAFLTPESRFPNPYF
jgi:hypothetical protein